MRISRRLRPADTVGIVSTSSPVTPQAVANMRRYFEDRGYAVKVAPHVLAEFGFMAGTPQVRADDFNAMLRDPDVRMLVTAMGGAGAVHLVPLIDYAALAADPKIIAGLSNPAVLLNAVSSTAGVPTFHGPNGMEFGGIVPLTPFTEANFWPLVSQELALPYAFPVGGELRVLRAGPNAEGRLFGGHLRTIQALIGTPWMPHWDEAILFVEEYEVELFRTDAMLAHFRLAGIFDRINGLIVGRPERCDAVQAETLDEIVLRNCAGYAFPVVSNLPLGHTTEIVTVPIGCRMRLNSAPPSFELLESPTR